MRGPSLGILLLPVAIIVILLLAGWVLARWAIPRIARRFEARAQAIRRLEQCKCGYDLKGLDVARCPECGRVIGFDATPEELGLTREELARIQEKRRLRAERDSAES